MATLMSLLVKLGVDSADLSRGLTSAESSARSSASTIASGLNMVGGAVVAGVGVAAGAAAAALMTTIGPASDLSETVSKIGIVFEDNAAAVIEFGETAATSLGMSENEALTAAGTYGNLFRALGLTTDVSSDMSTNLVQLAGDLASFNNLDPTEVLDSLRAGMVGEAEPLRRLGVNINQATIEAKAMELGLWNGVGAIDAASKAQASYALIMEQTTLAQGDFARTSGGVANQTRMLKAQFENIKATVGSALLPSLEKLGGMLNTALASDSFKSALETITSAIGNFAGKVVEAIPKVLDWFQRVFGWLSENKGVIVAVLAAIGVAVLAFGISVATAAWTALAPLLPVIAIMLLVAGVAYLVYEAWMSNFGGIRTWITDNLLPVLQQLWAWLSTQLTAAVAVLGAFWTNTLQPAMMAVWAWMQSTLFPFLQQLAEWIGNGFVLYLQLCADYWNTVLLPALQIVWGWMSGTLWPFLVTLGSAIADGVGGAVQALAGFWTNTLWPAILAVVDWMRAVLFPLFQAIANLFSAVLSVAIRILAGLWQNVLLPAIKAVGNWIAENVLPILQALGDYLSGVFGPIITTVASWLGDTLAGAFEIISGAIQAVTGWIQTMADALMNLQLPDWLTPGSPTPFELGLVGITKALRVVANEARLDFAATMPVVGGSVGGSRSETQKRSVFEDIYGGPTADAIGTAVVQALIQMGVAR